MKSDVKAVRVTGTGAVFAGRTRLRGMILASDGITYAGSSTDNKDLINTKATSRQGDYVVIASLDGTTAWQVTEVRGTFAKES